MNKKITTFIIFLFLSLGIFSVTKAMTIAELQDRILALQAQLAQLLAQLAQIQTQSGVWCHRFNTNLSYGTSDSEVEALQITLEKEGFTINSAEKTNKYFGTTTLSAVIGFQEKYKNDILTPLGLTNGTGFIGLNTKVKLNKLYKCTTTQPLICISDGCNGNCPVGCTVALDPDCGCKSGNACCGIGCNNAITIDTDCPSVTCGDGVCKETETCATCPADCGVCIPPAPILSPVGGESWQQGTSQVIRWTPDEKGVNSVMISLFREGIFQETLTGAIKDSGEWIWNIPVGHPSGSLYSIRVSRLSYPKDFIADSNYFSISSTATIAPPTVTSLVYSNVSSSSATLNGNITATNGQNADLRGFDIGNVYGTYNLSGYTEGTAGNYSYGVGAFSWTVSGLNPSTTYYIRAKTHNSAGWNYGQMWMFTTSATSSTSCTHIAPTITLTPTTQPGTPGKLLVYEVSIKNNNLTNGCSAAEINLSVTTCPAGWTCNLGLTNTLEQSISAYIGVGLHVTPPVGASAGPYNITVQVAYVSSTLKTTQTVTAVYNVVCTANNPTVTLTPNPQSGIAGTTLNYTVNVKNNDTAACAARAFNLTVYSCIGNMGWSYSLNKAATPAIAPGTTDSSATFSYTSGAGAGVGNYTSAVMASAGTNQGQASVIYTVITAPSGSGSAGGNLLSLKDIENLLASISNLFRILQEAIKNK